MKQNLEKYRSPPARILLLQGPVGPFFLELSQALRSDGAEVTQLTFNKGDANYSVDELSIPVTSTLEGFEHTFDAILSSHFDVIVMFGSDRPAHIVARKCAIKNDIKVLSFEEGYIRPGHVTLEEGGNNANSPLATVNVESLGKTANTKFDGVDYKGFWPMVYFGASYYTLRQVFSYDREKSFFHRETPIASEIFFWTRNAVRKISEGRKHIKTVRKIVQEDYQNFYVVPLQVPSDANMREASNGWTGTKLIHEAIKSFSSHAPKSSKLVFKIHPMSRGHSSEHKLIMNLARTYQVESRIHVVHDGSLGYLTKAAAGMLTINSTSGLSALHHDVPLLVLGKSIYTHAEIAHIGKSSDDLDAFWTAKTAKSKETRRRFLAHIKHTSLIKGDFYAKRGRAVAVREARRRILNEASGHGDTTL